jgi:hypothetical protein
MCWAHSGKSARLILQTMALFWICYRAYSFAPLGY